MSINSKFGMFSYFFCFSEFIGAISISDDPPRTCSRVVNGATGITKLAFAAGRIASVGTKIFNI